MDLRNPHLRRFLLCMMIFIIGFVSFIFSLFTTPSERKLEEAYASFQKGIEAEVIAEKEDAFNHALSLYLQLEQEHTLETSNGRFYSNVSTVYEQLQAEPEELLYRYRADALQKAFAVPHLLQLYVTFGFLAVVLASIHLWFPRGWLKMIAIASLVISAVFLSAALYDQYFAPVEAVIFQAAPLNSTPKKSAVSVANAPVPQGEKVTILDYQSSGKWLKIQTPSGLSLFPLATGFFQQER